MLKMIENQVGVAAYQRWPHWIARLAAVLVFPLIWIGGLVTTWDAGMAVPDWPNTYGYNLFLYPVYDWFFGPWDLFVEHGHRLLASLAGLVVIALVGVAWRVDPRRWFRWLTVAALLLIIAQGILGGFRVTWDERTLAKIHGCVGPLFFALICGIAAVSGNWWFSAARLRKQLVSAATGSSSEVGGSQSEVGGSQSEVGGSQGSVAGQRRNAAFGQVNRGVLLTGIAIALVVFSYVQLVIGAHLRHIDVTAGANYYWQLVVAHITGALLVAVLALAAVALCRARSLAGLGIRWLVGAVFLLVMMQLGLGLGTWIAKFGVPAAHGLEAASSGFIIRERSFTQVNLITAHMATGSLILAAATVMAIRCLRLLWRSDRRVGNWLVRI